MNRLSIMMAATLGCLACGGIAQASSSVPLGVTIGQYASYGGSTNGVYVMFSPAIPGLEGCGNAAGNEVWFDLSVPANQSMYVTFLSAVLAGRPVGFGVSGCGDAGQLPLIYRVDVGP